MRITERTPGVFVGDEAVVQLTREHIETIKQAAADSPRGRARFCAHSDATDLLHEMFIALTPHTYIQPHRHLDKSESFHIIEGELTVVIFNNSGSVDRVITLSANRPDAPFFYRISKPLFHTVLVRSDMVVIHEVTNGPFDENRSEFAPWSPPEDNPDAAKEYINTLRSTLVTR